MNLPGDTGEEEEYLNGTRLIYPMENEAMRFLNYIANKIFSILFTWLTKNFESIADRPSSMTSINSQSKRYFDK